MRTDHLFTRAVARIFGSRIKWLVLVLWLVLLGGIGPMANQIWEVTNDDPAAWLPRSAESTRVVELADRFPDQDTVLAVTVYARDTGLTDADRAAVAAATGRLASFAAGGAVGEAVASPDGQAMALSVPMPADPDGNVPVEQVERLREAARVDLPAGLAALTTGPASVSADIGDAFAGLDTMLLLVSAAVVGLLLLLTYRSPVLWLLPLFTVAAASQLASAVVYLLAEHAGLVVNSQSAGILTVLVFGAGTDYALLLIARYREELYRHTDRHRAMAIALRRAGPAVLASAATVALGLLCLLAADLSANRGLAPVGALGVLAAMVAMLSLLPVLLLVCGRWVFWPFVPRVDAPTPRESGRWAAIGERIARRPRPVWIGTAAVLAVLAAGAAGMPVGLDNADTYTTKPESVTGQDLLAAHYPAGAADPALVVSTTAGAEQAAAAARTVPGVVEVRQPVASIDGDLARTEVVLADPPDTRAAATTVQRLRDAVHAVPGAHATVGGSAAIVYDTERAQAHDRRVVIPLVLVAVLLVLIVLLRAVVAPLLLMATVILSFGSALGLGWLLFDNVFGFPAADESLILFGFLFLVALGVDYNIFLVSRAREEASRRGHRAGMLQAVAVTGGVITSAGVVLAATFAVLNVLPLVATAELGVLVGVGVLLDTLVVRLILVPALALDIGPKLWWPSRLAAPPKPLPNVVDTGQPEAQQPDLRQVR